MGYDIIGDTQIIGAAAADPDCRALMSNDAGMIASQFYGRIPAMRMAMSKLANLSQAMGGNAAQLMNPGFQAPYSSPLLQDARAIAAAQNNTPVMVAQHDPTNAYEVPFGFQSLAVAAGGSATITLQPAATFKANRMSIPQAIAPFFQLTAFLIGQVSVIMNGNAVPGEAFSDLSYNPRGWKLPTMQAGQPTTMIWQNISGAAQDLRGSFWGVFVT